jgi:peptide/nickel transport system substrate-binding protein
MPVLTRRTILAAAAVGSVLFGAMPNIALAQDTPKSGGTVVATWGGFEPQAVFVPGGGGSSPTFSSTKILEPLLTQDSDLAFHPALALSVEPAADFLSYTIKIRPGVTWHDGEPFTVDDVVFSAEQYWKPIVAGAALSHFTGAKVTGEDEVTLSFSQPTPDFFMKSILSSVLVVPKHVYEGSEMATNPANNAPVGTGPFKFKEWVRGSHIELVKNEAYWDAGKPYVDGLVLRYWRDAASRAAAMEAGELQIGVFNPIPAPDIDRLVDTGNFVASTEGYLAAEWASTIEFNSRNPIMSDVKVRQAILHAIDKELIGDVVYFGRAKAGTGFVSSVNKKFYDDDLPQYEFDPEKAKTLLDEAGYPVKDGKRFTVQVLAAGWFEENGKIGQFVKQALEDVDIDVDLSVPDRATSIKGIYTDYAYDIALSNHAAPLELVPKQTQFVTTDGIVKGAAFRNANGYSNPELDKVVEQLAAEIDDANRVELAHKFQQILAKDLPITIVVEIQSTTVANKDVKGYGGKADVLADSWSSIWLDH